MKELSGLKQVIQCRHTKERRAGLISAAIAFTLIISSGAMIRAEAAFPGRNGGIVFEALADGAANVTGVDNTDLFVVASGGVALRQITDGPESDTYPAWSPDGTKIAFTRAVPYQAAGDIFVINADGSGLTNLTQSPLHNDWAPAWSPDGTMIVFSSARNVPTRDSDTEDLYLIDSDGENLRALTSEEGAEYLPAWSPDSRWIAFRSADGLSLISPRGSENRLLVPSDAVGGEAFGADWSPDGERILFSSFALRAPTDEEAAQEVWVVNADGTGLRGFPAPPNTREGSTAWSPDGRKIVFLRDEGVGYTAPPLLRIYTMNADGSHVRQLVDLDLRGPAWPDWGPRP